MLVVTDRNSLLSASPTVSSPNLTAYLSLSTQSTAKLVDKISRLETNRETKTWTRTYKMFCLHPMTQMPTDELMVKVKVEGQILRHTLTLKTWWSSKMSEKCPSMSSGSQLSPSTLTELLESGPLCALSCK